MKANFKLFLQNTVLLLIVTVFSLKSQSNYSDRIITNKIKLFYELYVLEQSKIKINEKGINKLLIENCSTKLLKKIKGKELEFDPFLDSQDIETNVLKSLIVQKKTSLKDIIYRVSYIDPYSKSKINVDLVIVKVKNDYKIDSIVGF